MATECPVCTMAWAQCGRPWLTRCGHMFCQACLHHWRGRHAESRFPCPTCRKPLQDADVLDVRAEPPAPVWPVPRPYRRAASQTEQPVATTGEAGGAWHVEHRSAHAGPERAEEGEEALAGIGREEVLSQYGCKVEHLVRHIKYLRGADPAAKCVVFTQWTVMQQLVHHALGSHHVGVRLVAGPRAKREQAIDAFLFNPAVAVLILCSATDDVSGTLPPRSAGQIGRPHRRLPQDSPSPTPTTSS